MTYEELQAAAKAASEHGDSIRTTECYSDTPLPQWAEGDEVKYYGSDCGRKIEPLLYWYHGFGSGTGYLPDGFQVSCSWPAFCRLLRQLGLDSSHARNVDSFSCYQATYLGD